MEIRVPLLAEGISAATVVGLLVKEGDTVRKDQPLLELETEKAVAPLPSPAAGKIVKIHVREGDAVAVGQVIVSLAAEEEKASKEESAEARPETTAPHAMPAARPGPSQGVPLPAAPSVRKVAREAGIDLRLVPGSGEGGRITMEDLRRYMGELQGTSAAAPVDYSKWGPVTRKKMSHLRRKISEKMSEAWRTIPHVTQFDEADGTQITALRKKFLEVYEKKGVRLTLTSFLVAALVDVLKKHPPFNASLDEAAGEIITKGYYHIGIAVDTEQGLIVPVIRDADKKNLLELSRSIQELSERTRQRKVALEELQGGTFTLSNQGGIGGGAFTPIIHKPEAAILGVGQGTMRAVVRNEKTEIRMMLPLALSYDHRAIDGAQAARFITDLVKALQEFPEEKVALK